MLMIILQNISMKSCTKNDALEGVVIDGCGVLNKWKWPDIEGLSSYKGKMVHSANWDPEVDVTGKNVALIGAGSSGIQILPQIQPSAKRVDHYMSGKTWISPIGFGSEELHERGDHRV